MTSTAIESLEELGLTFNYTPPCEHSLHHVYGRSDAPASWVMYYRYPFECGCSGPPYKLLCDDCCQSVLRARNLICRHCKSVISRSSSIKAVIPL